MSLASELAELQEKERAAEELWAQGKRTFSHGGGLMGTVKRYEVLPGGKSGLPVTRMAGLHHDGIVHVERTAAGDIRTHENGIRTDAMGRPLVSSRRERDRVERIFGLK
jgi:hypothetical protein